MTSHTSALLPAPDPASTPMMAQYIEIKCAHPGYLLFYRMGDFYELFFDDAQTASACLGITLTKRGKHKGDDIPMAGVPVERSEDYLHRLIAAGHKVAVCEQVEDPALAKKRGAKSVVRREVVRLVTAGTLTEEALLQPGVSNYLLAISSAKGAVYGLAWADISTGELFVSQTVSSQLGSDLARIAPAEVLVPDTLWADAACQPLWNSLRSVTPLGRDVFDIAVAADRLAACFKVSSVDALGSFDPAEITAAAALTGYIQRTQVHQSLPLHLPRREDAGEVMLVDAATRANLELMRTLGGDKKGSLLHSIDLTLTPAGARLLAQRLASPSVHPDVIAARHDDVSLFKDDAALRADLRTLLKSIPDLARARMRLALQRGGPRDLQALKTGLETASLIVALCRPLPSPALMALAEAFHAIDPEIVSTLARALGDELPLSRKDGGFVRAGFDPRLDEVRSLRDESRNVILDMERNYADTTAVKGLKIKYNNILGWFIEVSAQNAERLQARPETFIHRQTMAGAMRFTTPALAELETKIASAAQQALALEQEIFDSLVALISGAGPDIDMLAGHLAHLDVVSSLAELAVQRAWVRPRVDASLRFHLQGGRHPVVEQALVSSGSAFIANDCDLSGDEAGQLWLLTGPNMGGKSTFLRQNALIVLLAQMGSFVPARSAHIGIVDRLFSRVGAADDLARGRSTFMVEMVETAAILNQATSRSLVILDEIGRGTSTFDGLSIAWACVEHLHEVNRCRALFATHFHELTVLSSRLARMKNATLKVTEWKGDVVFLHEVVTGVADRSYGIQVARLAGLPAAVIARARDVLIQLEAADRASPAHSLIDDLPLFAATRPAPPPEPAPDPVRACLSALMPDEMSPKQALEALYDLKRIITPS